GGGPRPPIVYCVVHSEQPFGSIKARAFGTRQTDPLYFQIMLQRRLSWRCREKSPFMSVTNDYSKALRVFAFCLTRRFKDIKILTIRTEGNEWKDEGQRMWHVDTLVEQLGLTSCKYYESEWVIEDSIPSTCIV
ncbi:hypothetical protein B0H66DRAFT_456589, partial [Apodospora peruviana]